MEDKEVGKCWCLSPLLPPPGEEVVQTLIRKLVAERALRRCGSPSASHYKEMEKAALRDFGIDPATWPETKNEKTESAE